MVDTSAFDVEDLGSIPSRNFGEHSSVGRILSLFNSRRRPKQYKTKLMTWWLSGLRHPTANRNSSESSNLVHVYLGLYFNGRMNGYEPFDPSSTLGRPCFCSLMVKISPLHGEDRSSILLRNC